MDKEEHKERHIELHEKLDELLGDFIMHTGKRPSETPIWVLMHWSHEQTIDPIEREDNG